MNRRTGTPSGSPSQRGRPRSEAARRAILDTALALLAEHGVAAVTMERIAARAGVGKPTIYRTWPNAHAVLMAALIDAVDPPLPPPEAADALEALRDQLRQMADLFSTRLGRSITAVHAAADTHTEVLEAFRQHFFLAPRWEGRELLSRAIRRGEVRRDLDVELALDLLYAPIWYRVVVHGSVDAAFSDAVLRQVIEGLAAPAGPLAS